MKILKIFGLVVGIHLFALVLILANPGCSSTSKPAPTPADTVVTPPPTVRLPAPTSTATPAAAPEAPLFAPASPAFNPDAPATAAAAGGVRFVPTRPGSPVAGALVAEPVADVTPTSTYVVKSGDSLWTIAKKHNLTLSQLAAANNLPASVNLKPGQKLLIPGKGNGNTAPAAAAPATGAAAPAKAVEPAPARATGSGTKHTVKSGESLGGIARLYGVKAPDIAVANNISDPAKIRAGMELVIPGGDAAKAAKNGAAKSVAPKSAAEAARPPAVPMLLAPPPSNQVPVIRIEDNPLTPAPKAP